MADGGEHERKELEYSNLSIYRKSQITSSYQHLCRPIGQVHDWGSPAFLVCPNPALVSLGVVPSVVHSLVPSGPDGVKCLFTKKRILLGSCKLRLYRGSPNPATDTL
jgi:hypothetical protein